MIVFKHTGTRNFFFSISGRAFLARGFLSTITGTRSGYLLRMRRDSVARLSKSASCFMWEDTTAMKMIVTKETSLTIRVNLIHGRRMHEQNTQRKFSARHKIYSSSICPWLNNSRSTVLRPPSSQLLGAQLSSEHTGWPRTACIMVCHISRS